MDNHTTSRSELTTRQDNNTLQTTRRSTKIRNLTAFWLFGLCNNFAYVIMLSAAHDILKEQQQEQPTPVTNSTCSNMTCSNATTSRYCNQLSTGAVLLADIIPTLVIKLLAPFFVEHLPYGCRNGIVVFFQAASYLIVSFSTSVAMSLFGVVCASIGAGLGEITFLSFASYFDKNVISTWSSGTGGAGIFGSLAYAGITQAGVSPRNTVLIMLVVPVVMALSYWFLLEFPQNVYTASVLNPKSWIVPVESQNLANQRTEKISLKRKLALVKPLLKYMIPLGLVYTGEYFINQGLQELINFRGIWLTHEDQYRWYQVDYQLGVFFSRSSVNLVTIKSRYLPVLAVFQFINVAIFFCEAYWLFMPSIWIVFGLILFEGLLGGAAYVNTFYQIRQEVDPRYVEFSLGVASVADSTGILIAGLTSIPVHNWVCKQPLVRKMS